MLKFFTPVFPQEHTENLLIKYNYRLKINDILAGSVVGLEKTQTLVDIGLTQVAFLPPKEIFSESKQTSNQILQKNKVGEFLVFYAKKKIQILSMQRLHYSKFWERFKQIDFNNMILFTTYQKTISNAKIVHFDGLDIYLPRTHLPKYYRRIKSEKKIIEVTVLEVKDKKHIILASTRLAILKKQRPTLQIGLIQEATVLLVKPFGVFLNLYGIKCLLHISEISNRKIKNIHKLYKKGDQILVKVLYVNGRQGKIAVSTKI